MITPLSSLPTTCPEDPAGAQRLMSVDALRGFDMFWIVGASSLVYALNRMSQTETTRFLASQLEHVEWEGFRFYDLIFPLFIFIVGVSLVFSLNRTLTEHGMAGAVTRVARRTVLLFVIGILYSGGLSSEWPDLRLMGVLNRIALVYGATGLLFCLFKPRTLAGITILLLAGYWALLTSVPIRDVQLTKPALAQLAVERGDAEAADLLNAVGNPSAIAGSPAWAAAERLFKNTTNRITGQFGKGHNLANHFDFRFLPGRKYDVFFDPEGLLSTFPAVATCLLGVFAGLLLRSQGVPEMRKVLLLVGLGLAGVALGWLWNLQFPVIKKIWTSSFVLVAGGYSAILLALFYLVVDLWKFKWWCQPFVWVGTNSITIYVVSHILGGFRSLAELFVGGGVRRLLNDSVATGAGDLVVSFVGLLLVFCFVRFLYRRKIFLRL